MLRLRRGGPSRTRFVQLEKGRGGVKTTLPEGGGGSDDATIDLRCEFIFIGEKSEVSREWHQTGKKTEYEKEGRHWPLLARSQEHV